MYWLFKGAEIGSSSCISLVSVAYRTGKGLVQDFEESILWRCSAAVFEDEENQKQIRKDAFDLVTRLAPYSCSIALRNA